MTQFEHVMLYFALAWTIMAIVGFCVYSEYLSDIAYNTRHYRPRWINQGTLWYGVN